MNSEAERRLFIFEILMMFGVGSLIHRLYLRQSLSLLKHTRILSPCAGFRSNKTFLDSRLILERSALRLQQHKTFPVTPESCQIPNPLRGLVDKYS